jgi:hypothetical protein
MYIGLRWAGAQGVGASERLEKMVPKSRGGWDTGGGCRHEQRPDQGALVRISILKTQHFLGTLALLGNITVAVTSPSRLTLSRLLNRVLET